MSQERKHQGRTIRKEVRIAADPQEVWNAWAQSSGISRWFVDRAVGDMRTGATVRWIFESFGYDLPVEVFEAESGRYLAFGGDAPGRPPALQEIFVSDEGGTTLLRLANSGFLDGEEWDDEYEGTDSGWEMALATLKYVLENRCAEPRVHAIAMRPATFEYAQVQPLFDTVEGLRRWLAEEVEASSEPLVEGASVKLRLASGSTWEATVLARTSRELLLGRSDGSAVLALKCFAMGPQGRFLALEQNEWGPTARDRAEIQQDLEVAVASLAEALAATG